MNKKVGGAKVKIIIGGILLVGVVAIVAVLLTIGKNNERPSEIGITTAETTKTVKTPKNTDNDSQSAGDSFAEPKGVSETTKPENRDQSKRKRQTSKESSRQASTQSTANDDQTDSSSQSANSESANNDSSDNNYAEAEEVRSQEELARMQTQGQAINPSNSYPWKDNCPAENENSTARLINGYPACQCTSYVAWKTLETFGITLPNWGDGNFWDVAASANGYLVNNTPTVNSIGQIKNSNYGHLFWVEQVLPDGSVMITEYNNLLSTYQLTGDSHTQDFGAMIIPAQAAANYRYIHPNQRVW